MLHPKPKSKLVSTVMNLLNKENKETVSLQLLPGYVPTVKCVSQHLVVMINALQSHQNKTMTSKEVDALIKCITPWVQERLINLNEKGAENTAKELYLPLITFLETNALWH